MKMFKFLFIVTLVVQVQALVAKEDPTRKGPEAPVTQLRAACVRPTSQYDMQINNVRSRMHVGGHIWSDAQYIVPKPAPGQLPVSALYAGGVWIGGLDRAGNIKLCAATYRSLGFDFFSGPLDLATGATELEICKDWDRFFTVRGENILQAVNLWDQDPENFPCDSISEDMKFWPGQGNPFWNEKYKFVLPDQPLGNYWDQNGDGIYNPCDGDFPVIDIRGCEPENREKAKELLPDEMVFWIYNDNGAVHTLSGPNVIQMEVQVQAFAYATNDEINDMTFYRYKLINKASEDITQCYFSMWIDPDLGCYQDDYIGCDVERSLAYVYNQDAVDGVTGCACEGTPTYCTEVPILGMDYFRGPRAPKVFVRDQDGNVIKDPVLGPDGEPLKDKDGNIITKVRLRDPIPFSGEQDTLVELGMNSFMYAENCGIGSPNPNTCDPQRGSEGQFYNYIRGFWSDGAPLTYGGTGYNPGSTDTTRFAFPDDPNKAGWSMCTTSLPFGDRRTLQATGPLTLQPGATNELIVGVVFVPDIDYPCPDISRLQFADDIAQALFDNCFDITDGPDAPDLTAVELDRELILLLSNEPSSNNFKESYAEVDLQAPTNVDNLYRFEGYKLYQLANASVTPQELSDINKARLIQVVDVKNGIKEIYNWKGLANPLPSQAGNPIWTYTKMVEGTDSGIRNSFRVIEDQFALTDRRLVNHKQYHFLVLAYAHNNYEDFNANIIKGQRTPYLEGRRNVGTGDGRPYTLVPRPIVYEKLNAKYGDGPAVTRLSGEGNPGKFLDLDPTMYDAILKQGFDGKLTYKEGFGPIDAKVVDPLNVKDGKYRLDITGVFNNNRERCAFGTGTTWSLTNITNENDPKLLVNNVSIDEVKEYILNNLGVSVTVTNFEEPGTRTTTANGALGARVEYVEETGAKWFRAIRDGGVLQGSQSLFFLDYIRKNFNQDPNGSLSRMGDGFFTPFFSTRYEVDANTPPNQQFFLSPAAREFQSIMNNDNNRLLRFRDLNNVDIVFTKDKTKWSKCIVIESASPDYYNNGFPTIGNAKNFEVRQSPSVDQNGQPLNDGTLGFSYFPGYAVDVETGKRLNIFFGENSVFSGDNAQYLDDNNPIGGDMIYNPSTQVISDKVAQNDLRAVVAGGQHYIYVTRQEYDGCASLATKLRKGASTLNKIKGGASVTWVSFPMANPSAPMTNIANGLIPNDAVVKLRVNNPFGESRRYNIERERDCETNGDKPSYILEFKGKNAESLVTQDEYVGALANVNVVPNPYYAYSAYETSQFTNVIKITNLPARAIVTIYTIDGQFIQRFDRDEREAIRSGVNRPTSTTQVFPDLEWDMKNSKQIPVASGVYLIHVQAPDLGEERTLKWFGIGRKFDPNGL